MVCERALDINLLTHLPVLCVVGSDGNIANGGVKPDVKDFVLIALERDWSPPDQVSGDAS